MYLIYSFKQSGFRNCFTFYVCNYARQGVMQFLKQDYLQTCIRFRYDGVEISSA